MISLWLMWVFDFSALPPIHISIIVYTALIYCFCFLLVAPIIISPCVLILCKQQGRRDWQPLWTRWEQSYLCLVCRSRLSKQPQGLNGAIVCLATFLLHSESYWRHKPWYLHRGEFTVICIITFQTNEEVLSAPIKLNFWRRCQGFQSSR